MSARLALCLVTLGCHVTHQTEITRPGALERIVHPEGAVARAPTLQLTDAGTLRFIEPLDCPTEEIGQTVTSVEVTTEPNLATFVVGVLATAIGGVITVRGATDSSTSNPYTYAGIGAIAVGLPLAIGPWLGGRTDLRAGPESSLRRPGPSQACGERALTATSATLTFRGIEVHGSIDRDGVFSVSPYQLFDAYATTAAQPWDVTAAVETKGGARTLSVVIEGGALVAHAAAFLANAGFDAKVEPLRKVPSVASGTLRASLTSTPDGPAIRLVLPVRNDGPGEAWGLRGEVTSTTKAIDGRILYIGHLANGASSSPELLIPITGEVAAALKGSTLDVAIVLRDAHGTAPETPIRFRGVVLGDAPR